MGELQWYFPESLEEVGAILSREGVAPHGGGTDLLRGGLSQFAGLMDVSRLGLSYARRQRSPKGAGAVVLGSALSYAAAARETARVLENPRHVLTRALGQAACTPLRNRITLGGSVACFPYWSDLAGPLLALEAEVRQIGARPGAWPVGDYLRDRGLRQGSLITEIAFPDRSWTATYHRHTRTASDRPMFTITVLREAGVHLVTDPRVVVVGSSGRFARLSPLERGLQGQATDSVDLSALLEGVGVEIPARMGFSAEYLQAVLRVELERALAANLRGD